MVKEIVGVLNVSAESSSQVSHIGEVFLAVSKDYWGYGLGQMLMEATLDWAEHSNTIRRLELTVQNVIKGLFISIKNLVLKLKV